MAALARWFRSALGVVQRHKRAYLTINLAYYGLVAAAMVFVASHPEIQDALIRSVMISFGEGPLAGVAEAYEGGHVLKAMALTFLFNFFLGSILVLLTPSMVVPFAGVFIGFVRAILWGLLLAPTTPELQAAMIPHSLTLLLEGQGYILAILASWILGRAFVSPSSVQAGSWRVGYARGVKNALLVHLLVAAVLIIAAVYEALEVIYLVPLLLP
jgi:hypothetical protein